MDKMYDALGSVELEKLHHMIEIKEAYLKGEISLEEGRALLREKVKSCTPDEFAYGEQRLKGQFKDEEILERMNDLLLLFEGVLVRTENVYPLHHPLWVYMEEMKAMEEVLLKAEMLLEAKSFIKNPWLEIYDALSRWRVHLSRKQNQLYPALEEHGFDRPTKIMWTFDDEVRDGIREAKALLEEGQIEAFLSKQEKLIDDIRDLMSKEQEVLLPTSYKLLSEEEFAKMSRGDHEIGFVFIETPPYYGEPGQGEMEKKASVKEGGAHAVTEDRLANKEAGGISDSFLQELAAVIGKYRGKTDLFEEELDVATGKLTLERINLIFKHLPVDLSYVDENEIVKFYSDTKHRVFPRSANVIGREVRNCHPAKSVHVVEEIIEKFRKGEQDQAEFWINKPNLFIYILYIAVRDEEGNFKGVLEMMQDCTRIRNLTDSRTLLTWEKG